MMKEKKQTKITENKKRIQQFKHKFSKSLFNYFYILTNNNNEMSI